MHDEVFGADLEYFDIAAGGAERVHVFALLEGINVPESLTSPQDGDLHILNRLLVYL